MDNVDEVAKKIDFFYYTKHGGGQYTQFWPSAWYIKKNKDIAFFISANLQSDDSRL